MRVLTAVVGIPVVCPNCGVARSLKYPRKSITGWCRKCRTTHPDFRAKLFIGIAHAVEKRRLQQAGQISATCRACKTKYPNTAQFFQAKGGLLLHGQCRKCKSGKASIRLSLPGARDVERANAKTKRSQLRQEMFAALGQICSCCGEAEKLFLGLEHVNGGGRGHRKTGGGTYLLSVKREGWPKEKYAVLCHNCNLGKHLNGGICPHQTGIKEMLSIKAKAG